MAFLSKVKEKDLTMKGVAFYNEEVLVIKQDLALLEESITRILLTVPGERVGNVSFGSKLQNYLFDLSSIFIEEARSDIFSSINKWEPRVTVNDITINVIDVNTASIKLDLTVKATLEDFTVQKILRY